MKKIDAYKTTVKVLNEWQAIVGEWVPRLNYAEQNYTENPCVKNSIAMCQEFDRYELFKQRVTMMLARDNERLEQQGSSSEPVEDAVPEELKALSDQYSGMSKTELGRLLMKKIHKYEIIDIMLSLDAFELANK